MPGVLNPRDTDASSIIRPTHVASSPTERRWYVDGGKLYGQDLNALIAQIRTAADFYSIPDTEGDDTVLQQIFQKFLPLAGGILSGDVNVQLGGGGAINIVVQAEGNARFIAHRFSSNATGPLLQLRKSRGTIASPAAIAQNDQMGNIDWMGKADASTDVTGARLQTIGIAVTPSATNMEARLLLSVVPAASVSLSELARWDHATGYSMYGANPVIDQNRHFRLRSYTIATLPSASPAGQLIRISDMGDGAIATSDGSTWLPRVGGTYTPSVVGVSNVGSPSIGVHQYQRNGKVVTVSGRTNVALAGAAASSFRISLPFASDFTHESQCAGGGAALESAATKALAVTADTTNNEVLISWFASGAEVLNAYYSFTYLIA